MPQLDATHDPGRRSWVPAADGHSEFPIQNLPLGVFSPPSGGPRGGVAIGDAILDLGAALDAGLLTSEAAYAAEAARDPIMALKAAAGQAGRTVFADHRDLFRRPVSSADLGNFDAVVLDPPRAGARDQIAELAASRVPLIAYVSCNPSTFARDAEILSQGGYTLHWIQPVGQFRWSTHVELAAKFRR